MCTDGSNPDTWVGPGYQWGLLRDNLSLAVGSAAKGTVFKITALGTLTTLYSFCSQTGCTDGKSPGAGLVQAANDDFYGATAGAADPTPTARSSESPRAGR